MASPAVKQPPTADDEEILMDGADVATPTEAPVFVPAPASTGQSLKSESRRLTTSHDPSEKGLGKHLWASHGDTRSSGQDECAECVRGDPRASAYIFIAFWAARADLYWLIDLKIY